MDEYIHVSCTTYLELPSLMSTGSASRVAEHSRFWTTASQTICKYTHITCRFLCLKTIWVGAHCYEGSVLWLEVYPSHCKALRPIKTIQVTITIIEDNDKCCTIFQAWLHSLPNERQLTGFNQRSMPGICQLRVPFPVRVYTHWSPGD